MDASVVIPTYQRNEPLRNTLRSLFTQQDGSFEVIVVDQTKEHDVVTTAFLADHANQFQHICVPPEGLPSARNVGIRAAKGEIILFCDDDVILEPDWVSYHLCNYADPTVGAVGGRILERDQLPVDTPNQAYISTFGRPVGNFASLRRAYIKTVRGGNMSFRRKVLDEVGYFDTNYIGTAILEESDLCYRILAAGYRIVYEPRAGLLHLPQMDGNAAQRAFSRARWYRDYFHNGLLFLSKNKEKWELIPFTVAQVAIAVKQGIIIERSMTATLEMLRGLFAGYRSAFRSKDKEQFA